MEMMLKSMGIQTDAIKQLLEPERLKELVTKIESLFDKLDVIDAKLTRIEMKLETIPNDEAMKMLSENSDIAELASHSVAESDGGRKRYA